ncbi:MAG: hypothetical protein KDA27_15560 [Candidatus Eisenbacteria bacterium]|uniref:Uncharacterized protein n=1 Tax=Eiseniibacteriota bacterium TaxID=2212470 RepID=A0A956SE12_UNCEI|nr:hypothetical protein [Candidatus Eisenbacteria bacterium]MCB9464237.1 hypothetical protein [Candidatus Eisenbacteria bacterium]
MYRLIVTAALPALLFALLWAPSVASAQGDTAKENPVVVRVYSDYV